VIGPVAALAERTITDRRVITVQDGVIGSDMPAAVDHRWLRGNGRRTLQADTLTAEFSGAAGSYDLQLILPQPLMPANGLTVRYRISGWQTIRYLAIGHSSDGGFRHVKIANPAQGEWVTFSLGYRDLAYLLANEWQAAPDGPIGDVRLYISGTPAADALIELGWAAVWQEAAGGPPAADQPPNRALTAVLKHYFRAYNPAIDRHAEAFLQRGEVPMKDDVTLPWALSDALPAGLSASGTYRYLWHALAPAVALLVYGDDYGVPAAPAAARDMITAWLDRSYFQVDADSKYCWYDHGTAERLTALVLMHEHGLQHGADLRFMQRLRAVMLSHGQLLESEAFYCRHQSTRYHNHGWFQDIALIAAAVALPQLPCAARWIERAQQRLIDQFDHLIVCEGPYAISVENSIGYHRGVQRLAEVAAQLLGPTGDGAALTQMAQQLRGWSAFLHYPDGRTPSQGDTVRRPNPWQPQDSIVRGRRYPQPAVTVLPSAGYAVVKGNHDALPTMLCLFATSHAITHKHADDLALTLFFDGIEWLIDPSFFSHDYTQPLPAFLRGASAHNRLVIDGRQPSISPGLTRLQPLGPDGIIRGETDGYAGVRLTRALECSLDALQITVRDSVDGDVAPPEVALMLHCGEGVAVVQHGVQLQLTHPCSAYTLQIDLPAHQRLTMISGPAAGADQGLAGADYGRCEPTTLIRVSGVGRDCRWQLQAVGPTETETERGAP
jgi:hypothetical protein